MKYKINDRFQLISDNDSKYTIMDTTSNGWYVLMKDGQPDMEDFVVRDEDDIDMLLEPITEEPTRWRAKEGQKYFYIDSEGFVRPTIECFFSSDDGRFAFGNYFKTGEEARKATEWLKAWKRLKDGGITFKNWTINQTGTIDCFATWGDNIPPSRKNPTLLDDLDLLFRR